MQKPVPRFKKGDTIIATTGALAGIEGIFETLDAQSCIIMLIELMQKPVALHLMLAEVKKKAS